MKARAAAMVATPISNVRGKWAQTGHFPHRRNVKIRRVQVALDQSNLNGTGQMRYQNIHWNLCYSEM